MSDPDSTWSQKGLQRILKQKEKALLVFADESGFSIHPKWAGGGDARERAHRAHHQSASQAVEPPWLGRACEEGLAPRRSPKSGHLWSPQNRPLNNGRSVRDIDGAAKPFSLARHEQCLERRKTTTSTRPWATSVVAAAHRGTDWCSPRDRQCVSQSGWDRCSRPWSPGATRSLSPKP